MSDKIILTIISVFVLVFAAGIIYLFIAPGDKGESLEGPGMHEGAADEPAVRDVVSTIPEKNGQNIPDGFGGRDPGEIERLDPDVIVGALNGRVLDITDTPVAGAEVSLYKTKPSSFLKKKITTHIKAVTDEKGAYQIEAIPVDSGYALLVLAAGYATAEMSGLSVAPNRTISVADFRLSRGITLKGTVTEPSGSPLEGVEVSALDQMKKISGLPVQVYTRSTRTDSNGGFALAGLNQGQYEITFIAQGYRPTTVPVNFFDFSGQPKVPEPLTVTLHPSGLALNGRVISANERPIPDARIQAHFTNPKRNATFIGEAKSDKAGHYILPGLSEGKYRLQVSAVGYFQKEFISMEAGTSGVDLVMNPNGVVEGTISATGPLPRKYKISLDSFDASVRLMESNRTQEITQGPKERFRFPDLFPGKYTFLVQAKGFARTRSGEVEVKSGQTTSGLEIQLLKGGEITGMILDSGGKGVSGARVSLMDKLYEPTLPFEEIFAIQPEQSKKAVTGTGGKFTLSHIRAGIYCIKIEVKDMARKVLKDIAVEEGGTTDLGKIKLAKGGGIKGTAYTENGLVAAGVKVTAVSKEAGTYKSVMTNGKGRFEFTHLGPGEYLLSLNLKDIWTAMKYDTSTKVYVTENQVATTEIYPRLRKPKKK